jgi:6,7-dimethyl-8-ribityllumazine synthase
MGRATVSKERPEIDNQRLNVEGSRFAVVVSRWNSSFTDRLREGAVEALQASGATDEAVQVFQVPGAFELPLASLKAAESGRFDAVIALGVVIRGETPHFEYVAGQAASGIMEAGLKTGIPVMFGVVTADTVEQAADRCGEGENNKGHEAAIAAVEVVSLYRKMAKEQGLKGNEKILSHVV